jgi:hypothetical protein
MSVAVVDRIGIVGHTGIAATTDTSRKSKYRPLVLCQWPVWPCNLPNAWASRNQRYDSAFTRRTVPTPAIRAVLRMSFPACKSFLMALKSFQRFSVDCNLHFIALTHSADCLQHASRPAD